VILSLNVEDPNDPEDIFPYIVKTDNYPGVAESRTISVPSDSDDTVMRERCFNSKNEGSLAKWAAPIISEKQRKMLRFSVGDNVAIRVKDDSSGYEQWKKGTVIEVWSKLPGKVQEGFLASAEAVPYLVELDATKNDEKFYCHRDDHTLIRKPDNIPQKLGKTISNRFETKTLDDGSVVKFDHVSLRFQKLESLLESDSDDAEEN